MGSTYWTEGYPPVPFDTTSVAATDMAVAEDLKVDVVSSITGDFDSNVDLKSGFRVWECSIDLARYVHEHPAPVTKVLELGCGHALPGIAVVYQHQPPRERGRASTASPKGRLLMVSRYVTGAWGEGLTRLLKGDAGLFDLILSSEGIYKYCSCLVAVVAITTSPVNSPAFMPESSP
ncbi:histidine protein methyltransferase 1 [Perkinsus olseni]|uniref:protein-histidine N-methyltransferase n=1 Tax=Perkinsus olseni TaxID=32597 RepID=A0A7J6PJI5_PEROL|nr:histidine protein methyltransferase 1 [Perkinsus olseni]